ncbi:MAG: glycosyltransferase [Acidobacteriia bacterium]|nr:glycosyltransferase [Terriglobia bacterium]
MKPKIKVAFASGTEELNAQLVSYMRDLFPELPLYVVSEFPPEDSDVKWIPYNPKRRLAENLARCRAAVQTKSIRLAGVMLVPNVPFRRLRLMALIVCPLYFLAVNENLDGWMIRPRCALTITRHFLWRARNFVRWHFGPGGTLARRDWRADFLAAAALLAGFVRPRRREHPASFPKRLMEPGISVIIPSRNGKELLEAQLPGLMGELPSPAETIVVDNGSDDGTTDWLARVWPQIKVEHSEEPLSFAAAVNRGILRAQCTRICLLNNDMVVEPGFFSALDRAFEATPGLFSATAQIRFPEGVRREETGKAVMAQAKPADLPLRCDEPLPGEDSTYVLYGSGGCSLYDTAKLRALGGFDEGYAPAYVEDLDLGYRAWQRGWPSVFVAGALVEHRHRATTSRYYTEQQLERMVERNYLRFLVSAMADRKLFREWWTHAVRRLWLRRDHEGLREAVGITRTGSSPDMAMWPERQILALTGGETAVFPGRAPSGKPRVVIASPYLPFPLSHGGAVRMYNLMRRVAGEFDQILVCFTETGEPPAEELLDICVEVVLVRRIGTHSLPYTGRPDVVEEFASVSFHAALEQTVRKWRPGVAQLEFTQMAQYAAACEPARTILVEHDVTLDLYRQLLALEENWELRRQVELWRSFEFTAWRNVSCVVTMSEKDRAMVKSPRVIALPNGVDLVRFQPSWQEPDPGRLLFIGSFAHLPNVLAAAFFLDEVWPQLDYATLHVIAGARYQYHLARYADRVRVNLYQPGVFVEDFVADVRPAYQRAEVVIAPLTASAGTNIKILEAMAMGKAVVSTPAGVNGLDLLPGDDFLLVRTAAEMVEAVRDLLSDPAKRHRIEAAARRRVERTYDWDAIARQQTNLYREIL